MSHETLIVEREGGLVTVTLKRPQSKNALSTTMADELMVVFTELRRETGVRAVLLTGAGGNFCSGGDVKGMGQSGAQGVTRTAEQRRGAAEALQMGLALEVCAPEALLPRALAIARSFCGASATAMSMSKHALQASLQSELSTMLDLEAAGQAIAAGSEHAAEAVRRFVAKEPPQFQWPTQLQKIKSD